MYQSRTHQQPRHSLPNSLTITSPKKSWKSARALSERRRRASDLDAVRSIIRDTNHSSRSPLPPLHRTTTTTLTTEQAINMYDISFDAMTMNNDNNDNYNYKDDNDDTIIIDSDNEYNGRYNYCNQDEYEEYDTNNSDDNVHLDLFESNTSVFDNDYKSSDYDDINNIDDSNAYDDNHYSSSNSNVDNSSRPTYLDRLSNRLNSIRELNRREFEQSNDDRQQKLSAPYMQKLSFSEIGK